MAFPNRTVTAQVKRSAEDALRDNRNLIIEDIERIGAVIQMADTILALSTETEPLKLELLPGIGMATARALRARGVKNLIDLAHLEPDTIAEFCAAEGVVARGHQGWPERALEIIEEYRAAEGQGEEEGESDE